MKNNFKFIILIIKFFLISLSNLHSSEQFNFDITEVEILEKGNKFKGIKRGTITTDNGIIIDANQFIYNKITNILNAEGEVKILDKINKYVIYSDTLTYFKNEEEIYTKGNSRAIDKQTVITADIFEYYKSLNIIKAKKNVIIEDPDEDIIILANDITYQQNQENILTKGITEAKIQKKYTFFSKDVLFNRNLNEISSRNKSQVYDDKFNFYELDEFKFYQDNSFLKGKNVIITSDINLPKEYSDQYQFASGFFDLKKNNFDASETKITMKKNIFDNIENDPRLIGISSSKKNNITQINKGVFTSCKKTENCPPWHIEAKKITHDQTKKQLTYENALLKIYDLPVVYFPKFFHPDPTVERQSGILKPILNESQILGSSLRVPYFRVLSKESDITLTPNVFDTDILMLETEFRRKKKYSTLLADVGYVKGYKSSLSSKKKNISHLFTKYKLDLNLDSFISSKLDLKLERVTNDTYLKVFDSNLTQNQIKPSNKDQLTSSLDLSFDHKDFNFSTGLTSYETLSGKDSDRYQFILPYYNFSKNLFANQDLIIVNLDSSGSNNLKNTNNLRSRIINNLSFESSDFISNLGFKNNFKIHTKNLNTVAKNDNLYKSSPQIELMSIFQAISSVPLIKLGKNYDTFIEPKVSFRFNPGDMKDYSNTSRKIGASNIFSIDRLGLSDSFEEGKSLTVGLDYRKENIENINKYFEFKVASVFRNESVEKIPSSSSIKESGNLIGSIRNNVNESFDFTYDFSIDNDLEHFEYNSLSANYKLNNFSTAIKFIEENGKIGDANSIENSFIYNFDENNYLSFNTRRNRKISFTEFYDLIYEYKNDCLTAGVKYKKTYYQDRDLLPTEDFMISITIFPLTIYEKSFDRTQLNLN